MRAVRLTELRGQLFGPASAKPIARPSGPRPAHGSTPHGMQSAGERRLTGAKAQHLAGSGEDATSQVRLDPGADGCAQAPGHLLDADNIPDGQTGTAEEELLAAERHAAPRDAFTCLHPSCQQLMALLIEDPPVPYAEISARLGIPVGSIGPTRRRCLDKLRRYPAIAALIDAEPAARG